MRGGAGSEATKLRVVKSSIVSTREERAAARASWPGRIVPVADEGAHDDLSAVTTPEQRLEMMVTLARDAFGDPPSVPRSEAPGRVVRRAR